MSDVAPMLLRHFPGLFLGTAPIWIPLVSQMISKRLDADRLFAVKADFLTTLQSWVVLPLSLLGSAFAARALFTMWAASTVIFLICIWILALAWILKEGPEGIQDSGKIVKLFWRIVPLLAVVGKIALDEQLI